MSSQSLEQEGTVRSPPYHKVWPRGGRQWKVRGGSLGLRNIEKGQTQQVSLEMIGGR